MRGCNLIPYMQAYIYTFLVYKLESFAICNIIPYIIEEPSLFALFVSRAGLYIRKYEAMVDFRPITRLFCLWFLVTRVRGSTLNSKSIMDLQAEKQTHRDTFKAAFSALHSTDSIHLLRLLHQETPWPPWKDTNAINHGWISSPFEIDGKKLL